MSSRCYTGHVLQIPIPYITRELHTTRFNIFFYENFCIFKLVVNRYVYYWQAHEKKQSVRNILIGNLWTVGESVGNKYIDGFANG
jgi:hypothetical protein